MTYFPLPVLRNTSKALTPQNLQIHGFLKFALQTMQFIHRIWCLFRKVNVYRKPSNFLKLAAGHTMNWIAGNQTFIQIAAQSVLIAARITDLIKEQTNLVKTLSELKNYFTYPYFVDPKISRKEIIFKKNLSPSTQYFLKTIINKISHRFLKIMLSIKNLVKTLFLIQMKTMDALSAFSYGEENGSSPVNELFVNSSKCLKALTDNRKLLCDTLKKNKQIISFLFSNVSSLFTVDQLINSLETGLHFASKVSDKIENTSEKIGNLMKEVSKNAAFGLFQAAGLTDLMPDSWILKKETLKEEIKISERFPSLFLIKIN